jgi:glycosyltransferase involved in cell wall biosynthesis
VTIVHLVDYAAPYGGSYLSRLCCALEAAKARGWQSQVVVPLTAQGRPWVADIQQREVPVLFSPPGNRYALTKWVSALLRQSRGPTVLHCHFATFDIPAVLAARRHGRTPVFWHVHNTLTDRPAVRARNTLTFGLLGRLVEGILCVAPDVVESVKSRLSPSDRTHLLANAIDSSRFPLITAAERIAARDSLGLSPDASVLLHFGWDWQRKGGDLFLRAVRLLRDHGHPEITALTVGGGAAALAEIRALGLDANVRVHEPTTDVRRLQAAANLFLSPSRGEGMPLSVAEALSGGLGVVATDLVGQAVIGRGLAAFRLTGFDPWEIASASEALLARTDEEVACDAEAAHRHIERTMNLEVWSERLMGFYKQALEKVAVA